MPPQFSRIFILSEPISLDQTVDPII
jgi:hypothetical protein